jgi:hypothetical protein
MAVFGGSPYHDRHRMTGLDRSTRLSIGATNARGPFQLIAHVPVVFPWVSIVTVLHVPITWMNW